MTNSNAQQISSSAAAIKYSAIFASFGINSFMLANTFCAGVASGVIIVISKNDPNVQQLKITNSGKKYLAISEQHFFPYHTARGRSKSPHFFIQWLITKKKPNSPILLNM